MTPARPAEPGFTLLEMIVCLAVMSLIAMAGSGLLLSTLAASRQSAAVNQYGSALQAAHALLRDDFRQLVARPVAAPEGLDPPTVFEGWPGAREGPLARFTRTGWVNPAGLEPRGNIQRVEYLIAPEGLVRRAWARTDATRTTPYADQVLLTGFESLELRYLQGTVWRDTWYSGEGTTDLLPDAIEILVRFSEDDVLRARFITAGSS